MANQPRATGEADYSEDNSEPKYCVNVSDDTFEVDKNTKEGDYSKAQYESGQSAIRLMSLMVSGGVVGVNACIAVLLVFSRSNAVLAGSVVKARRPLRKQMCPVMR